MANTPAFYLGGGRALDGAGGAVDLRLPAHHFVTHGVVVGGENRHATRVVSENRALVCSDQEGPSELISHGV